MALGTRGHYSNDIASVHLLPLPSGLVALCSPPLCKATYTCVPEIWLGCLRNMEHMDNRLKPRSSRACGSPILVKLAPLNQDLVYKPPGPSCAPLILDATARLWGTAILQLVNKMYMTAETLPRFVARLSQVFLARQFSFTVLYKPPHQLGK